MAAINGFDSVGHYLRAGLIVNQCATYALTPVAGCSAKFPAAATASSGRSGETSAVDAAGDDPRLRATAIALAQALGQEVEKARSRRVTAKRRGPRAARARRRAPRPAAAAPSRADVRRPR